MNQTIEQMREQSADKYLLETMEGSMFSSEERRLSHIAYTDGAEWEYNRSKWVKVEDARPEGLGICLFKPAGEIWPSIVSKSELRKGWIDFPGSTWAEIPL